ncbi:MAG: AtpZ/AtpI family protein [Rhizobiaceae bacterium]|nr:AtpZ/AtpI family protein [Rhizobiaceae bacterium]
MAEREHGEGSNGLPDADLTKRREALAQRLATQRARLDPPKAFSGGGGMRGAADGMKLASEFVGGVLVGAGIGYLLDLFAGTSPFGLIVFLVLGFVAGVLNVLRSIGKTSASPSASPAVGPEDAEKGENEIR